MPSEIDPDVEAAESLGSLGKFLGWAGLFAFAPLPIAAIAILAFGESPNSLLAVFAIAIYWPIGLCGAIVGFVGLICSSRASQRLLNIKRKFGEIRDVDIGPPYPD
jgi:hypothetical protein